MLRKISIVLALILGIVFLLTSVTIAVLYFTHSGEFTVAATTADDPTLPRLVLDDYPFHAETFGSTDSPVIIALHGGPGGDYRSILPLKALAEDGYQVVFYDQRGAGLSPRVIKEELTVEQYITDLDRIINHFSPDSAVTLIGHSWGAMLASAYIAVHPDKVNRMILAEPGFLDNEHMERYYEITGLQDMKPSASMLMALAGAWAESLHIKGADSKARGDYLLSAFFTTPMEENPLAGYYPDGDIDKAAGEYWRFGSLASSSIPPSGMDDDGQLISLASGGPTWPGKTLFLSGSENTIIGPEFQRSQMHHYPSAELAVIEGAGHTMIGEKPLESLAAIRSFLEE